LNSSCKITLSGNPNCGKTSLFNALTGLNQQVGNYPGITVDKKTGYFQLEGKSIALIDVPGTYSLKAKSEDERVALSGINDPENADFPDILLYVADATNLKRSLLFFSQLYDKQIPIVLALNMTDIAERAGLITDVSALSQELGVPVVAINAREEIGINELKKLLTAGIEDEASAYIPFVEKECKDYQEELNARYSRINEVLSKTLQVKNKLNPMLSSIDKLVTHKVFGYIIFAFVMLVVFQAVFSIAEYPMGWIEDLFAFLGSQLSSFLPDGMVKSLLIDGILSGLGGVVIFIPQIALLFLFIGILEDSGYMSRVSFLLDKVLNKFGLHGKSVIPLMSGIACAIPAVMSARTISNSKERLITILVTPLITCAARLPVYVLIISIIIPNTLVFGIFSYQGIVLMGLYVLGFVTALLVAWVLKKILKTEDKSYFVLEMPIYKWPRWKSIVLTMLEKVKVFVFDAGKIIVAISILLWVLSSNAPSDTHKELDIAFEQGQITEVELGSKKLEASYIGILGKVIEPAIRPMGFDWKIGISLITSFAAREVFVGSMATIYSVGDAEDTLSIREKMMKATHPDTGEKVYTIAVGVALLIFYAFALQCMSTIAIVYRETKSVKWTAIQLAYMTGLAYFLAMFSYQVLR
jgi:ferrous iron transport protein B